MVPLQGDTRTPRHTHTQTHTHRITEVTLASDEACRMPLIFPLLLIHKARKRPLSHFWQVSPLLFKWCHLSSNNLCEKRVSVLSSCPFFLLFLPFHHSTWHSWAHVSIYLCCLHVSSSLLSTRDQFMKNTVYIIYVYIYLFKLLCLTMCFVSGGIFAFGNKHFTRHVCFWKHSGPGPNLGFSFPSYVYICRAITPIQACTPS